MLSEPEVLAQVYRSTAASGKVPLAAEVAAAVGGTREEALAAFAALRARKLLFLGRESGEIAMANPFSAVPTPFLVTSGARSYFANCVWDAYGILAALHADGRIQASCACCGEAMGLAVEGGEPSTATVGSGVAHFAVPAAHWWDDLPYT